ncbi:hypothetical protein D3C77_400600 [compost metagenome]
MEHQLQRLRFALLLGISRGQPLQSRLAGYDAMGLVDQLGNAGSIGQLHLISRISEIACTILWVLLWQSIQ